MKIKVPIIGGTIILFSYEDTKEFENKYKNYSFDVDVSEFHAGVFELSDGIHICFHDNGDLTHGIIAHECKHAINLLFTNVHFKLDEYNDEMECYFLKWLVDEVYKRIKFKL